MKRRIHPPFGLLTAAALCAAFMACCRIFPGFAGAWMRHIALPAARWLAGYSARVPFPLLEPIAILAAALCALPLTALSPAMRQRSLRPLGPAFLRTMRIALSALLVCALAWYPAYFIWDVPAGSPASAAQIAALCESLIDALNASEFAFPSPDMSLERAVVAVRSYTGLEIPEGAVKFARYPEWMDLFGLGGLYSPWTAEAIVHPSTPEAALPFTAVHELMHLCGIADEGLTNIAAWTVCMRADGPMADSARLWALRYGMGALADCDPGAWLACTRRMNSELTRVFYGMGGPWIQTTTRNPVAGAVLTAAGLSRGTANYNALADWLAVDMPG